MHESPKGDVKIAYCGRDGDKAQEIYRAFNKPGHVAILANIPRFDAFKKIAAAPGKPKPENE